jgi:sec-independent protein translocase protein TatB
MFPEGRLFDFLIVGAIALIVVGPKDLPMLMRKVGQFMARIRGMAAEFRASFDELARQSELDELRKEVQALRTTKPIDYAAQSVGAGDLLSDIRGDFADTNTAIAGATTMPAEARAATTPVEAHAEPAAELTPELPFDRPPEPPPEPPMEAAPQPPPLVEPAAAPAPKRTRKRTSGTPVQ